jgi:hypothetical protein
VVELNYWRWIECRCSVWEVKPGVLGNDSISWGKWGPFIKSFAQLRSIVLPRNRLLNG